MSLKHVLFVCVENSNRSQMAEAFARHHVPAVVDAWSARSHPSGNLNPHKAAHREDWTFPDPRNMPPQEFAIVRDEIERRVLALLNTISKKSSSHG
ncbi:MAG: hypothetical protein WCK47_01505 [bacterium]|nr:hypothetical protein [Candidatus Sumerlaeota bacterium]